MNRNQFHNFIYFETETDLNSITSERWSLGMTCTAFLTAGPAVVPPFHR